MPRVVHNFEFKRALNLNLELVMSMDASRMSWTVEEILPEDEEDRRNGTVFNFVRIVQPLRNCKAECTIVGRR